MHELTLCDALIDLIDEERRQRRFSALKGLKLEIGRFGGVDPEALVYAFEVTRRGSWLEGVGVEVARPLGRAHCLDCDAEVDIDNRFAECPRCGGARLAPTGGDAMRLVEMEIVA